MTSRISIGRIILYSFLAVMAVIYLTPIYMTIVTALKPAAEINLETAWNPPSHLYWASFTDAFNRMLPNLRNSVTLTVIGTILSALLGSLNGYVLSKWRFRGANVIFTLMLFGMFIPYQIILIPLFQTLRSMHLYGGLPGLILAHVVYGIPITTLIFRNFYVQIPNEVIESAALDGAGFFGIYRRIVFPLSWLGMVVVIIWQFTQIWNDFLFGVTLTNHEWQPITVALAYLAGGQAVQWNLPMAGSILAALPPLLIYIIFGRYFISGLLAGSVKG